MPTSGLSVKTPLFPLIIKQTNYINSIKTHTFQSNPFSIQVVSLTNKIDSLQSILYRQFTPKFYKGLNFYLIIKRMINHKQRFFIHRYIAMILKCRKHRIKMCNIIFLAWI